MFNGCGDFAPVTGRPKVTDGSLGRVCSVVASAPTPGLASLCAVSISVIEQANPLFCTPATASSTTPPPRAVTNFRLMVQAHANCYSVTW